MTRQNVTDGPREILTQKCPTCGGDGIVLSTHSAAIDAERRLRALAKNAKRGVEAFRVELEESVASHLIGPGASRLTEIEALAKRRFFLEGKAGVPVDHFKVKAEGKLADIAPKAPVEEGAEIRLELVEVGQHDIHAGVGKLDGLSISVADASKLVGKKVKVRIERVLNGTAYATVVETAAQTAKKGEGPITAESEAEKPTRAPRKKKVEQPKRAAEPVAEEAVTEEPLAEEPEEPAPAGEEPPKPKKKTRRGSRGGRGRKKKPAGAAAENGQPEETPAAATIHVPSPDLGQAADGDGAKTDEAPAPKKKRTRRGSRGGRNRRKKPAAASSEAKPESSNG
jgi:predicted RNA-binding protein with TRAM domain